jgi:hypothetical protein
MSVCRSSINLLVVWPESALNIQVVFSRLEQIEKLFDKQSSFETKDLGTLRQDGAHLQNESFITGWAPLSISTPKRSVGSKLRGATELCIQRI